LKTICGFIRPKKGEVICNGENLVGLPAHVILTKGISYIPQNRSIFPHLSVEDNLKLGGWINRKTRRLVDSACESAFERFPVLKKKREDQATALSGGEARMLEIAKALMVNPNIILVDEPTAGLAPKLFDQVYEELVKLSRVDGKTVVLVDQNIRKALKIADFAYVLEQGRNRIQGPRADFEGESVRGIIKDWLTLD
jgi:ABC-type branched-subunit amino acid transport system ATPase component